MCHKVLINCWVDYDIQGRAGLVDSTPILSHYIYKSAHRLQSYLGLS